MPAGYERHMPHREGRNGDRFTGIYRRHNCIGTPRHHSSHGPVPTFQNHSKHPRPPTSPRQVCGTHYNTITLDNISLTMRIDDAKIRETLEQCTDTLAKHRIPKTAIQSLMRRLNHASKLALHARIFLNRGFHLLRSAQPPKPITLDSGFKEDLQWFVDFLLMSTLAQ